MFALPSPQLSASIFHPFGAPKNSQYRRSVPYALPETERFESEVGLRWPTGRIRVAPTRLRKGSPVVQAGWNDGQAANKTAYSACSGIS